MVSGMSKNIDISRKRTLFWDNFKIIVFWQCFWKCPHFQENNDFLRTKRSTFRQKDIIWRSLWKFSFCPYFQKYQHFEKKNVVLISLWKIHSLSIFPKICTFEEKGYCYISLKKLDFFPYVRKYQHFEEKYVFGHISENINILRKISF